MNQKKNDFPNHLYSMDQLDRENIEFIFGIANKYNHAKSEITPKLENKVLGSLFFQPSFRTHLGYKTAMLNLGGKNINFVNTKVIHSMDHFEKSLEDVIRIASQMVDGIILRHVQNGSAKTAAAVSTVPLINVGDGTNEHPTQALIDLWLMYSSLTSLDNAIIGLIGDPNTRTFRSLVVGLTKFKIKSLLLFMPFNTILNDETKTLSSNHNINWNVCENIEEVLNQADAIKIFPTSLMPFDTSTSAKKQTSYGFKEQYRVTKKSLLSIHKKIPIWYPGISLNEHDPELESLSQVLHYKQVKQSILIRMALLETMLT